MNDPQPITTAPVDTPILTDYGIVSKRVIGDITKFYICDLDGEYLGNGAGDWIDVPAHIWCPLPKWVLP